MADRRTRDQLRASNEKLRTSIRRFVAIQERWLAGMGGGPVPADWARAYLAMKELMGARTNDES